MDTVLGVRPWARLHRHPADRGLDQAGVALCAALPTSTLPGPPPRLTTPSCHLGLMEPSLRLVKAHCQQLF